MAKRRNAQTRSIMDEVGEKLQSNPVAVQSSPRTPDGSISIDVPCEIKDVPSFRLHVDLSLSGRQAKAARIAASGLDRDRITLENGKRCVGTNDLVRWFLEKLADELAI